MMIYSQTQRFIATILAFTILLQSCNSLSEPLKAREGQEHNLPPSFSKPVDQHPKATDTATQKTATTTEEDILPPPRNTSMAPGSRSVAPPHNMDAKSITLARKPHTLLFPSLRSGQGGYQEECPEAEVVVNLPRYSHSLPTLRPKAEVVTTLPQNPALDTKTPLSPTISSVPHTVARQAPTSPIDTQAVPSTTTSTYRLPDIKLMPASATQPLRISTPAHPIPHPMPSGMAISLVLSPYKQLIFRLQGKQWETILREDFGNFFKEKKLVVGSIEAIEKLLTSWAGRSTAHIDSQIHLLDIDPHTGQRGLPGGGFWGGFWRAVGCAVAVGVACAAVGTLAAIGFNYGVTLSGVTVIKGVTEGLGIGAAAIGIFAGIGAGTAFLAAGVYELGARQQALDKVEAEVRASDKLEQKITNEIEGWMTEINAQLATASEAINGTFSYAYKNKDCYLKTLKKYKKEIQYCIDCLEECKKDNHLWHKDNTNIDTHVETLEKKLEYINKKTKELEKKLRDLSWKVFNHDRSGWEASYRRQYKQVERELVAVTSAQNTVAAFSNLRTRLDTSIRRYENWAQEPALFSKDRTYVRSIIQEKQQTRTQLVWTRHLIDFSIINEENRRSVRKISRVSNETALTRHCIQAVKNGIVPLVHYAIFHKNLPVNSADRQGNTLLHHAAQENQVEMVRYLIEQGANRQATNRRNKKPKSLAGRGSPDIAILELLEQKANS